MSTKNHPLQIRINQDLRETMQKAADKRGLPLSTWVKMICKEAAEQAITRDIKNV